MPTYDDAVQALARNELAVVHLTFGYYVRSDSPQIPRVRVEHAVTWCPPPVIASAMSDLDDIPSSQQVIITRAQAEDLVARGAEDERESDWSKMVVRLVQEREEGKR